ncbi:TatD family hydrolase [uncultured Limosilactobacillus sp.]|uniref:TatD family hydrolase n=1 Tax=uncultured Limosilactobacillus sp. TaxID=2837629 RepID=UPI0025DBE632|nr:TatD family hydrolase [uncultured Limosilactobacillus sp.]
MLIDIHCHNDENQQIIQVQQRHQMRSMISSTSNTEYERNRQVVNAQQKLSYGVHPWQTIQETVNMNLLAQVSVVGEIGLDTTWTAVPLDIQRSVLKKQLEFAAAYHKPVVLHVKGCERELLEHIQEFPTVHKLVHWYSANYWLKQYLAVPNIWFSVGPDVFNNLAVKNVAQQVPSTQLFIESDGLEGISWAQHKSINEINYWQTMQLLYKEVACLRRGTAIELEQQIEQNWQHFFA